MGLLKRVLFGPEPQTIDHPVFGRILLLATKGGAYWEAETQINGYPFSVAIEATDSKAPTEAQAQFYEAIVEDPDSAFAKAAPALVPEYEKWARSQFPSQWRSAFRFVGMSVPLEGKESNPWELSFECLTDKEGLLFTCRFQHGSPVGVSIDG